MLTQSRTQLSDFDRHTIYSKNINDTLTTPHFLDVLLLPKGFVSFRSKNAIRFGRCDGRGENNDEIRPNMTGRSRLRFL